MRGAPGVRIRPPAWEAGLCPARFAGATGTFEAGSSLVRAERCRAPEAGQGRRHPFHKPFGATDVDSRAIEIRLLPDHSDEQKLTVWGAASMRGVSGAFAIGLNGGRVHSAATFVFEGSMPGQSGPLCGWPRAAGRPRVVFESRPRAGLGLAQALQATHTRSHLMAPLISGNRGLL